MVLAGVTSAVEVLTVGLRGVPATTTPEGAAMVAEPTGSRGVQSRATLELPIAIPEGVRLPGIHVVVWRQAAPRRTRAA